MKAPPTTSPYAPDLAQLRSWLEKMIAALQFLQLVAGVLALIGKMRDANTELVKQLTHLRRARPRSESLERLERQLLLKLGDGVTASEKKAETSSDTDQGSKPSRKGRHPGRAGLPAHLERVEVLNPVPAAARTCPDCGSEMTTVGHARCEKLDIIPAKVIVVVRLDERVALPEGRYDRERPEPVVDRRGGQAGR
jgi:hypothetical protein